jgi:hypothetical protein
MFLAVIREGEHAVTPTGRRVVILGTLMGAVHVQDLDDGDDFYIMPRHLRHLPTGDKQAGARVETFAMDTVMEALKNGSL